MEREDREEMVVAAAIPRLEEEREGVGAAAAAVSGLEKRGRR